LMAKELIVLVADKSMRESVKALLGRHQSLGIRPLSPADYDVVVQINYDSSVVLSAHEFLRSQSYRYRYAMVLCDRHGCGREDQSREELEADLEDRLRHSGWEGRSAAVVIDPELENWLWTDSPHVEEALGWKGRRPGLREWMREKGFWAEDRAKPDAPQRCLDEALYCVQKPRSSALFRAVAERVSLRRCQDPAFVKLARTLRSWFGQNVAADP